MYSLNMSVGELRTKMREQFERHRYVKQLPVVDMLLFQSHAEYQVGMPFYIVMKEGNDGDSVVDGRNWAGVEGGCRRHFGGGSRTTSTTSHWKTAEKQQTWSYIP